MVDINKGLVGVVWIFLFFEASCSSRTTVQSGHFLLTCDIGHVIALDAVRFGTGGSCLSDTVWGEVAAVCLKRRSCVLNPSTYQQPCVDAELELYVEWTCVNPSQIIACNSAKIISPYESPMYITSWFYPALYPPSAECALRVNYPFGMSASIRVLDMSMTENRGGNGGCKDYIAIADSTSGEKISSEMCGTSVSKEISEELSSLGYMEDFTIFASTDSIMTYSGRGFLLKLTLFTTEVPTTPQSKTICGDEICFNTGKCTNETCVCTEEWKGETCQYPAWDDCLPNPCQNNAVCHDDFSTYKCECLPGYVGDHCQRSIPVGKTSQGNKLHMGPLLVHGVLLFASLYQLSL